MKYPDKIYIYRNMMLLNKKECDCYNKDNGKCLHDNNKCAIVEYQKVKK